MIKDPIKVYFLEKIQILLANKKNMNIIYSQEINNNNHRNSLISINTDSENDLKNNLNYLSDYKKIRGNVNLLI